MNVICIDCDKLIDPNDIDSHECTHSKRIPAGKNDSLLSLPTLNQEKDINTKLE